MTNYEKLREKINEKCPYLLAIRFGCEYKTPDGILPLAYFTLHRTIVFQYGIEHDEKNCEILGTPPTLQDFMATLENSGLSSDIGYYNDGMVVISLAVRVEDGDKLYKITRVVYDLIKPFSEQSENFYERALGVLNEE